MEDCISRILKSRKKKFVFDSQKFNIFWYWLISGFYSRKLRVSNYTDFSLLFIFPRTEFYRKVYMLSCDYTIRCSYSFASNSCRYSAIWTKMPDLFTISYFNVVNTLLFNSEKYINLTYKITKCYKRLVAG